MIHVIATITVKAGKRQSVLEEFHRVMPSVHAEQGCVEYGPAVDVASGLGAQGALRSDVLVVVEKWDTLEALLAHTKAPHMAEYRERVKDLVVSVQLQVLRPA